jgi:hypothetical protein
VYTYRMKTPYIYILIACFLAFPLAAQDSEADNRAEAWERMRMALGTPLEASRTSGLNELDKRIQDASIDAPSAVKLLELVLLPDSRDKNYSKPAEVSFPSIRIHALRVLSRLSGPEAQHLLETVLNIDFDNVVLEQALRSARSVMSGVTPGLTMGFTRILRDPYPNGPHDSLMLEVLNTISWFHANKGTLAYRSLFDAIVALSDHPRYLQIVRRTAIETIRALSKPSIR